MKSLNRLMVIVAAMLMLSSPLVAMAEEISADDTVDMYFDNEKRTYYGSDYIDFSSPGDRPGYEFVAWDLNGRTFTQSDSAPVSVFVLFVRTLDGYHFTSVWEPKKYTATFVYGDEVVDTREFAMGEEHGDLPVVTREGYDLVGWSTDGTESGLMDPVVYDIPEDTTFYPVWKPKMYDVTLLDGSTVCDTIKCEYKSVYPTLPTIYKAGYVFRGWSTTPDGTVLVDGTTTYETAGDSNLYAAWAPASYNVTLMDGGVDVGIYKVTYLSELGELPVLKKTGMTFIGWSTDGTEAKLVTSKTVYNQTADSKLYAVWKANDYTATFEANGGTLSFESKSFQYGSVIGELPTAVKDGFVLKGWSLTADGKTIINANTPLYQDHDLTIYAIWESEHIVTPGTGSDGILDNPLAISLLGILVLGTIGASLYIYRKGQM